jgi:acetyltransferase-like isoleucine patch superfamily enzyme
MKAVKLSQPNISHRWRQLRHSRSIKAVGAKIWSYFWLRFAGLGSGGRVATWLATWFAPPYKMRKSLACYYVTGYISPSATIARANLQIGNNVFIGDRVQIFAQTDGGMIVLRERVHLHNDTVLQTAASGKLTIGKDTHIQPRCRFLALEGSVHIGSGVQIAPDCSFDSRQVHQQGYQVNTSATADITIENDVWIGHGVTVLAGVTIGAGTVVGSGAVVTADLPPAAIAVGMPARSVKMRTPSNI